MPPRRDVQPRDGKDDKPVCNVRVGKADGHRDRNEPRPAREARPLESPSFDRLRGDGVTFLARSHSIPGDSEQLYDWIDEYVARVGSANPECFRPSNEWRTIAIEGYYDGPFANGCESIAVVGGPGHAWEFRLIGDPNPELFDILLSEVNIDDDSLDGR